VQDLVDEFGELAEGEKLANENAAKKLKSVLGKIKNTTY
jgi:hypothetical protein